MSCHLKHYAHAHFIDMVAKQIQATVENIIFSSYKRNFQLICIQRS
uniref:Uncharacterized protein n=1 Tax=Rhizophora mucronata TaxID=61149 RepID=A0A2P2P958_RHIMU